MNTAVAGLYGSLTVNADGTYTYVPNAAAINALHEGTYTDMFTVQTTDVHGAVGAAILTIDVNGANDAPTLTAETRANSPIPRPITASPTLRGRWTATTATAARQRH